MNPEDIGPILDEIGERIGPAGEYAWELAVRWQVTAGIIGLVASIAAIVAIGLFVRWVWAKAKDADSYDRGPMRSISAAFGFLFVLGLMVPVWDSLLRLLNPEFAALRDLIGGGLR